MLNVATIMNVYFGYIRVSTTKQGEQGVSLQEQKDAITRYADRHHLIISQWFEEWVTAAKKGRPVFSRMVKLLKAGKACGLAIHKIDRSARNLHDWAQLTDLLDLSDLGVDIRIAADDLDLRSRSGRLTADILAAVAADFIRNLREETRKGFYGRLKQGLYPLPAPIGYLDKGKGQAKVLDPGRAPLVRKAFELYKTGQYNLVTLLEEITKLGLRNRNNHRLSLNGLSWLLNNPFYIGIIRIRSTGETFDGCHQALISKSTFDAVQQILRGKTNTRTIHHAFLFRRLIKCKCTYSLIGETHKGHVYYRCHTRACDVTSLREDMIEASVRKLLLSMQFSGEEQRYLKGKLPELAFGSNTDAKAQRTAITLQLSQLHNRIVRLTDAYIDQAIDKNTFEERKASLLMERRSLQEALGAVDYNCRTFPEQLQEYLELAGKAWLLYKMGFPEEKRELLKIVTSNLAVNSNDVVITPSKPFSEIAKRFELSNCDPNRDIPRTWDLIIPKIVEWLKTMPDDTFEDIRHFLKRASST